MGGGLVEQQSNIQAGQTVPLVSVTIPSYNAASTLGETLDSVLAQTYSNVEVIVVDDGSTDNTEEVLSHYASRVISIRKTNGGLASARNVGCRMARGKYIALMDADDLCMPERLSMQVEYMEQHSDIVLCSTDYAGFNEEGLIPGSCIATYYSRISETPGGIREIYPEKKDIALAGHKAYTYCGDVYEEMAMGSFIHPPTVLFRKSLLEECGLFDESIKNLCDFDWLVRASQTGKIGFIDRPLLKYRFSDKQMSGPSGHLQIPLDIIHVMEKTFAADPALFKRKEGLFRRQLSDAYLAAANALVEGRRLAAVKMLIRSCMLSRPRLQSLKVLIKAVVPSQALQLKRRSFQHDVPTTDNISKHLR